MKHLKTKLMASVAMLMVATVMMSSASFAWFTISTAPEVSGVSTQLATNGNLEIALAVPTVGDGGAVSYTLPATSASDDTGKNVTWGNVIDLSQYFTTTDSHLDQKLRPASFATADDTDAGITASAAAPAVSSPTFGTDGRMSGVTALTPVAAYVDETSDDTKAEAGQLIEYQDAEENVWAYRTDYFIRTNTDGGIYLAGTDTATDRGNGTDGAGCFLKVDNDDDTATGSEDYLDAIRVYAVVLPVTAGDAGGAATLGTAVYTGNLCTDATFEDDKLFDATANTTYVVQTYIVWDGAETSNADMATIDQNVLLNIQFEHKDDDGNADLTSLLPGGDD